MDDPRAENSRTPPSSDELTPLAIPPAIPSGNPSGTDADLVDLATVSPAQRRERRSRQITDVRLIAVDFDGTIFRAGSGVSRPVLASMHRARASGIDIAVVTGRTGANLPDQVLRTIPHCGHIIGGGGALRWHPYPNVLSACAFEADVAVAVSEILADNRLVTSARADSTHWGFRSKDQLLADIASRIPIVKYTAVVPRHRQQQAMDVLREQLGDRATVTRSRNCVEITPGGVTKAWALADLARDLGVSQSEVLAIGDSPNDLSMLAWAGCGVAMGDAPTEVLERVDFRVPPIDRDGAAVAIDSAVEAVVPGPAGRP